MSAPCFKCESRGSCRHRTVEEPVRPFAIGPEPRRDLRRFGGQGYNVNPNSEKARRYKEALRLFKQ